MSPLLPPERLSPADVGEHVHLMIRVTGYDENMDPEPWLRCTICGHLQEAWLAPTQPEGGSSQIS